MTDPAITALTEDFDLDGWIDGTCKVTVTAKVYQRGDLVTEHDALLDELRTVERIPKEQRSVTDTSPDVLIDKCNRLAEQIAASALTVYVQDRTDEHRRGIRDRLVKELDLKLTVEDDLETIFLHQLADAIVKVESNGKVREYPGGTFPANKIRDLKERLGDAAFSPVRDAFIKVISEAPTVSAPLSRSSSSRRGGGI